MSNSTLHSHASLFLANHLTLGDLSNWFVILVNAKIRKFRLKQSYKREISGFLGEVAENCAVSGYYAASSSNFIPTFRNNMSVPVFKRLKMGPIGCPETSVRNHNYLLRNDPEERSSQTYKCMITKHN